MNSSQEPSRGTVEARKRGRLLLIVVFWVLTGLACLNVRILLGRRDLPPALRQLEFFGCLVLVYLLVWTGTRWGRRLGVIVLLFWAIVSVKPAIVTGPYLPPIIHFGMAGLLLFLAVALSSFKDVGLFLDSRRLPEGRGLNASEIVPVVRRIRRDYLSQPRGGVKDARFRRNLLAVVRRTIARLTYFQKGEAHGDRES